MSTFLHTLPQNNSVVKLLNHHIVSKDHSVGCCTSIKTWLISSIHTFINLDTFNSIGLSYDSNMIDIYSVILPVTILWCTT